MKRAFLVHGWDGNPQNYWFPWLTKELETRGFAVVAPQLPDALTPRIRPWVSTLSEIVGAVDEETFFVGHSMGCQTILRFLQTLPPDQVAGGAILVAGFTGKLTGLTEEEKLVARPWEETPIDLNKVKGHVKHLAAVLSDNDPWVPLESNRKIFAENLGAEIVVEHTKDHFETGSGVVELPIILNLLKKWA